MSYVQPVWRAGVASNAGVRPEDSWKMPANGMGGPGCSGEWAGGYWEDVVYEDEDDLHGKRMPKPKPKPKPRSKPRAKPRAKPETPFDGMF